MGNSCGSPIALGLAAVTLIVTFAGLDIARITIFEWSIIAIILIALALFWYRTRLPHVPSKKVGFGVAIAFEDSEHAKRIRSDLILTLRELVTGSQFRHEFEFVEFSNSVAGRLNVDHPRT